MRGLLCGLALLCLSGIAQAEQGWVYLKGHVTIPIEDIPTNVDPEEEPTWCDLHSYGFPAEVQYWNHDVTGQQPGSSGDGVFYWEEFDRAEVQTLGNSSTITGYKYYYKSKKWMTFPQNSGYEWEPITLIPMGYITDGMGSGSQWWDMSQKHLLDYGPPQHTILIHAMTAPSGYEFIEE